MTSVVISDMRAALDAFEHFFDDAWYVPTITKIQIDNFFRINIYTDNDKWYKFDPSDKSITEHTNKWRR